MTCLDSCPLGKYALKVICPARKFSRPALQDVTFFEPWSGTWKLTLYMHNCLFSASDANFRIEAIYKLHIICFLVSRWCQDIVVFTPIFAHSCFCKLLYIIILNRGNPAFLQEWSNSSWISHLKRQPMPLLEELFLPLLNNLKMGNHLWVLSVDDKMASLLTQDTRPSLRLFSRSTMWYTGDILYGRMLNVSLNP